MLQRLFPVLLDNDGYRGRLAALWLFALLLLLRAIMGVNGALNTRAIATGDGIRLDGLGDGAAETILRLFRSLSLAQLPLVAIGAVALWRWRAMVPFLYLVLLADLGLRRLVASAYSTRGQTPPRSGSGSTSGSLRSSSSVSSCRYGAALRKGPRRTSPTSNRSDGRQRWLRKFVRDRVTCPRDSASGHGYLVAQAGNDCHHPTPVPVGYGRGRGSSSPSVSRLVSSKRRRG